MKIENISIDKLIPYKNNPRNNDNAVEYVANSIRDFGFKVPIVIDKNNVIVTGHTRLRAAEMLGIKEVPCIKADDLTDEQVKAFRIADNSVGAVAEWDISKLNIELAELSDFNIGDFALDNLDLTLDAPTIEENLEDEDGYFGDERERTNKAYNLAEISELDYTDDFWEMPIIHKETVIPNDLIGFNYAKSSEENKNVGIHFFIDDYQFERVWNQPKEYIEKLSKFQCILSPDFSLYMDMPMSMKIWNVYRSRFIGAYYQTKGIKVIPTLSWAEPDTFKFCFKGIEKNSVVAVSTIGVKEDIHARDIFNQGILEIKKDLEPSLLLVYGGAKNFDFKNIPIKLFENKVTERIKNGR